MTASNFKRCLKQILTFEGGYVDHPRDPGGATNMGITIGTLSNWLGRRATKQEVRDISPKTVASIYKRNYWNVVKGDHLPDGLDLVAFDGGVNSGPQRGAKWLQRGLGVAADGKVGSKTLTAAAQADGVKAIQRACAARMGFLRGLRTWGTFGRGWSRRVHETEALGVAMYTRDAERVKAEADKASGDAKKRGGGATTIGGGGAAASFSDIPDVAIIGVVAVAILIAIVLAGRAANHKGRAKAYVAKAKEMKNA